MSGGTLFIVVVVGMFGGVFAVAIVVKWWEVRKAAKWRSAEGKVVVSGVRSWRRGPGDAGYDFHDTEMTNEPDVQYVFRVGGKEYRGRRVTIGEKTSSFELEAILARYPVGATVTVYYDPADPNQAVLERDFPGWVWGVGIGCLAAIVVAPMLAVFFYNHGLGWLRPHLAHPDAAPFVTAAAGFGLLVLLFALSFTSYVWKVSRWPTTTGRIVSSGADAYEDWRDRLARSYPRTFHKAAVVYRYEVNGREYLGDRVRLGVVVSATSPGVARRLAAKYPVGREVTVYYDPQRPGESVLRPRSLWHLLIWLVAAGMLYLAWWAGMG